MKILMSTIGTRGDVQPLVALGLELMALGHSPGVCAPPNFKESVESLGIAFHPIGPDVKQFMSKSAPAWACRPRRQSA